MTSWQADYPQEYQEIIAKTDDKVRPIFSKLDSIALNNQSKVLKSFQKHHVSDFHFQASTGYGYHDEGRETLESIYADVFNTEDALVRPQIISGTHAITVALFGNLLPGDELLYVSGEPYDTLQEVIGFAGDNVGSMMSYGITVNYVPLTEDGKFDGPAIKDALKRHPKIVAIQRSKGYASRDSFTIREIKDLVTIIKEGSPSSIVFVDNCYGEFIEEKEPTDFGVDLIAGSLIKNAGGGLAKIGGYIAGKSEYIKASATRLYAPGIGKNAGATVIGLRDFYQGFFMAPHVAIQALKSSIFAAALLDHFDIETHPKWDAPRTDIIQTVYLSSREAMITFAKTIQKYSPVDSNVIPEPADMAGYENQIIMAGGSFVEGATIELSTDGPIRPPFSMYLQGGLTFEHAKLAYTAAVYDLFYNK